MRSPILVFVIALGWIGMAYAGQSEDMLPFGGMEGPFADGLAQGWVRNCYGVNKARFSPETADAHGERTAQRVTCTRFESGGVQFHSSGVAVVKGRAYTLRLWMKGTVTSPVYVGIRKHGEPYTGYLKRFVRVKNAWRPYVIAGEAGGTDPDCGIYIMFAGTGTLLVDDVSLIPGIHEDMVEALKVPPRKGNRVYNAGFEAGPEGWAPSGGFALSRDARHSGQYGAFLASGALECRPFPVRAGCRYTLTAYLRAQRPNTKVTLKLMEWADSGGDFPADRHEIAATVTPTADWARYQMSGVALPHLWEGYVARVEANGPLYVDDAQVEEGDATPYRPMHSVEVGADSPTRWCSPGESVTVRAYVAGAEAREPVRLVYTLEDLWGRKLAMWRHRVQGRTDTITFRAKRLGLCRVRVSADTSPAAGEVCFGVFPKREPGLRKTSPFGTHVTDMLPGPTRAVLASEAMGVGWARLHDFSDVCHWYRVEPEKGRYVWHDAEVDDFRRRGFTLMANLGHPPLWAGRADPQRVDYGVWTNAPPRDMAEWEDYVFRVVTHYRDRIRYWEVWNEPFGSGFFCGTPEEYAEILKAAYRAIKRADPRAVVVGGCFYPDSDEWTRRVLARGGLDNMDVLSYHIYWTPAMTEAARPGDPPLIVQQVRRYVELMRARGAVKPIWMTEGGVMSPPFVSWLPREGFPTGSPWAPGESIPTGSPVLRSAAALVKAMVEMRGEGVQVICYYYTGAPNGAMPWFSVIGNGCYVLMDYDGRPKPTMMAYSALSHILGEARLAGSIISSDLTAYVFGRGGGSVAVVWSRRALRLSVRGAAIYDLMGNRTAGALLRPGEPVYVCAPALAPGELRRRLRPGAGTLRAPASGG
jgi:hypothetical protein